MVPSERTVTIGVGHGKKAARNIDSFLRQEPYYKPSPKLLATYDKLKLWYFAGVKRKLKLRSISPIAKTALAKWWVVSAKRKPSLNPSAASLAATALNAMAVMRLVQKTRSSNLAPAPLRI